MAVYPLRSISFVTECLFPQRAHPVERLQQIHHIAFQDPATRYANFQVLPQGVQLANPTAAPGVLSNALILPDRLRIQEQGTGISREDFRMRVERLAFLVHEELQVAAYSNQQFLIQSLVNPRAHSQARDYVRESMLGFQNENFSVFGNDPGLVGMRLRFPSNAPDQGQFHVRMENYLSDPRSLFLENVGVYSQPVSSEDIPLLGTRFDETYRYLAGPVIQFVAQFEERTNP